ncbi:hypothetical protein [Streptomyces sp. JJ36]|uniref:hypothetical protein n=1 Tax=Streptomyces sp. JJ36 TaxID=2736645 RepID=UPI001F2974A7|nr:hypothetical protein [Streptomyces sp. JJ36]MCF6523823.1 hypothetical protein [Streptomyces sp. JJ36]
MQHDETDLVHWWFDGSLRSLFFLAGEAAGSPRASLEDEVLRFCRTLISSSVASRLHSPSAVADQLALLALRWDAELGSAAPQDVADDLERAAGRTRTGEFLHLLADLVRAAELEAAHDYTSLPMNHWEALTMYRSIFQFTYLFDSGDFGDRADAIRARIRGECSTNCRGELATLVAEVSDALVRFPDDESLEANLGPAMPWATRAVLIEINRQAHEHLSGHHAQGR